MSRLDDWGTTCRSSSLVRAATFQEIRRMASGPCSSCYAPFRARHGK
jgi:hypothetical protein